MFNWLSLVAGLAYVLLGVYVMIYKFFPPNQLEDATAYAFGGLLVVYGVFRLVRFFLKIRKKDE
jgi:C4-dicarboxylate transporter/malic acid transporter